MILRFHSNLFNDNMKQNETKVTWCGFAKAFYSGVRVYDRICELSCSLIFVDRSSVKGSYGLDVQLKVLYFEANLISC